MAYFKSEYYHKGADSKSTPDISFSFRRRTEKQMGKWTLEERAGLHEYIENCEERFKAFIEALKSYTLEETKATTKPI